MMSSATLNNSAHNSSHVGRIDLPDLPFELQFSILSQIPPNELFLLHRVSQAWHNMLHNHYLLEAINSTLPYLTSAPDLTSRMKRRMRMVRGEPVWVKPFDDVFPWASSYREKDFLAYLQWERYSDGWFVRLSQKPKLNSPGIILTIAGLHTDCMAEVDLLDVMKEVNLAMHVEWFEPERQEARVDITRFSLDVQAGLVAVGLQANLVPPGERCLLLLGT